MRIDADYQQYTLDETGLIADAGERMVAKAEAIRALGLAPDFVSNRSVLELGCDHGFWSFLSSCAGARQVLALDRNREVRGRGRVDLIAENTARARRFPRHDNVHFRTFNLGAQWHEFGLFDVVLSMSVYHHVYAQCGDHESVWTWLARHTVPGGLLIWEGPTDATDPVIRKDVPQWCRGGYTRTALFAHASAYFDIVAQGPALHETTREVWICQRRRDVATGTDITAYRMLDGAKGASKAFLRDSERRISEIANVLGVGPVPGSLNLALESPFDWQHSYYRVRLMDSTDRRDPDAPWAPRWCRFYPVVVGNVGGWAMRFEGESYPDNFVEVVGPHRFRDMAHTGAVRIGGFLYPSTDIECAPAILRDADRDIGDVLEQCSGRSLIIQAGGNVGVYPQRLAQHFAKVITFEPDPVNFACLKANVTAPNVEAHHAALGLNGASVHIERFPFNCGASRVNGYGATPGMRIDDLALDACDMIWLDVEGSEFDTLKGAADTIRRFRPVLRYEEGAPSRRRGVADGVIATWLTQEFSYRLAARIGRDVVMTPC